MCGIFAVSNHHNAARLANLGLFALQHRGQESAGIVTDTGETLLAYTGMGLVSEIFTEDALNSLSGRSAIGHVRYSTAGVSHLKNAQPLAFEHIHGPVAIAHNGNLVNAQSLRRRLEKQGAIFQSSTDSEVIVHLMARSKGPLENAIIKSLKNICGAYSFIFMAPGKIIACRDPLGFRPLVLGKLGKSFILASETPAIDLVKGEVVREIEPGEVVVITKDKIKSIKPFRSSGKKAVCVFEQVYFSRPDSIVNGRSVQASRYDMGRLLAKEMQPVKADIVVPVPDSGLAAAMGFAKVSGIRVGMGFMRNHYIGRSFIKPTQELRELTAELKLAPIRDVIQGRNIVLIDDSIVRGTTSRKIIKSLKKIGARRVIMAISSPPIISPCYYGIDTPSRNELIASRLSLEKVRRFLGADELHYLSLENMLKAAGGRQRRFCTACFTGKYPTPLPDIKK